ARLSSVLVTPSFSRSSFSSGESVEAPTMTRRATSSTTSPCMCFSERYTTSRGRSAVPEIFLRTRRCRRNPRSRLSRACLRLTAIRSPTALRRARLAGLPPDLLALVPDPLALVRLRGPLRTDLRRHLPPPLLVDPLHHHRRRARRRDGDPLRLRVLHRVRVAHVQHQHVALLFGPVSDADQLQRLPEAGNGPFHHIGDQRARQTVQRPVRPALGHTFHHHLAVIHPHPDLRPEGLAQLALGPLDPHRGPVHGHGDPRRDRYRLLPDSRHDRLLPHQREDFPAHVARSRLPFRHHTSSREPDRD